MSQSYIEAHKADAAFRALEQQVAEMNKKHQELSGRNQTVEKRLDNLSKREEQLETRVKAAYVVHFQRGLACNFKY